jgi:argininosuccinate synthase
MKPRKIVIAYSGGLDTSVAVHFLKKHFKCEVHAYCADLGQNEDWDKIEKGALEAGADSYKKENLQDHFIDDFVFEALKGNGTYENNYLLGTPLARPVIVEGMVKYAHGIGAILYHTDVQQKEMIKYDSN